MLACLFRDHVLERRLRQQLKDRPNVWGIGLWQDDEHEEVRRMDGYIRKIIRKLKSVSIVVIACVVILLFECV